MGLCKTKAKKSSPDTFKFYVVLAGDDKATGGGRATGCGRKLKAPSLQTKGTINEGPPENMGFNGKNFEYFRQKKNKIHFKQ